MHLCTFFFQTPFVITVFNYLYSKLNKVVQEDSVSYICILHIKSNIFALLQILAYFEYAIYCGKYSSNFHVAIQHSFDRSCDIPINQHIVTALKSGNLNYKVYATTDNPVDARKAIPYFFTYKTDFFSLPKQSKKSGSVF